MKPLLLAVICLSFTSATAHADEAVEQSRASATQVAPRKQIGIIPTAGLSVFSASGVTSGRQSMSTTAGFVGGLLGDIDTGWSQLQIETGALFLQEGDSIQKSGFTRTSDYLAVPLTLKLHPFAGFMDLDVDGGMMPALLVAAKTENSSGIERDAYSRMTPYDIQVTVGVGYSHSIADGISLTGRLSYVRGLVSFLPNGAAIYNQGATLTTGLIF